MSIESQARTAAIVAEDQRQRQLGEKFAIAMESAFSRDTGSDLAAAIAAERPDPDTAASQPTDPADAAIWRMLNNQ